MNGTAYSNGQGVRVLPPYRSEAMTDVPRNGRLTTRENVRRAVAIMLQAEIDHDPRVWWARFPYAISVRPEHGTPGLWRYGVDKVW